MPFSVCVPHLGNCRSQFLPCLAPTLQTLLAPTTGPVLCTVPSAAVRTAAEEPRLPGPPGCGCHGVHPGRHGMAASGGVAGARAPGVSHC